MLQPKLGLPSLAICSNAARSVSTIMENQLTRYGYWLQCQTPILLLSSVVLLVDLWQKMVDSGREADHPAYRENWTDINRCMNNLELIEGVWFQAGKFLYADCRIQRPAADSHDRDIVRDLAKISPKRHSPAHQSKAPPKDNVSHSDSDPGVLHGHDVLGYPIYTPSLPLAHASGPSTSSDADAATASEESLSQHGTEDYWKLLEAIGMAQMPVEMDSWTYFGVPGLEDPAPEQLSMQPYFSASVDPNAWFDQTSAQ